MPLEIIQHTPNKNPKSTPLLFVHGAWHGAWCWEPFFMPYFTQHGYRCYALSLRGHGNSPATKMMRFNSVHDYVADVAEVANQIEAETGKRPIIIGHSMGGYITQKYLEKHIAPAAILLASIPVFGALPFLTSMIFRYPLTMLKAGLFSHNYHIVANIDHVRALFFSESVPMESLREYHKLLDDESTRIILDTALLARANPKKINPTPLLVIAAEDDKVFPVKHEKITAQAYGTEAIVIPNLAHDVMIDTEWQVVADHILTWLSEQNL